MSDETPERSPKDVAKAWRGRIQRAEQRQKTWHAWWEAADQSYTPSVTDAPDSYASNVRTNRTFTLVERKQAELFYQRPEVQVSPSPLMEADPVADAIAAAHGTLLNETLGLEGVQVRRVGRRAVLDYLLYGAGWTKLGYRAHTTEVPTTDPMTGGVTVQPVILKGEVFWESVSPKQVLVPADWTSTDFDKAPWLGMRFEMTLVEAKRLYGEAIPKDFSGSQAGDQMKLDRGDAPDTLPSTDTATGVEVFYRRSVFEADESHPDVYWQLVLLDGVPEPVVHRPSPYQAKDAQGRLTPDSLLGSPFHPLVIRDLADSAYIMSDAAVSLPLVKELDTFRDQMVRQRDINLLRWIYNTDAIGKDDLDKLTAAPQGGMIGLPAEAFASPGGPIQPLPHGPYPRENFSFNDYVDNDLARTHAIDATAAGTTGESGLTATEANIRQANVNTRLGWEQAFVADWFLTGAIKVSSLLQRFVTLEEAAAIVGPQAASAWDAWRRTSPARLAFTMLPDSSLRNDTPLDRKQLQELFTYLANDPTLNRPYLIKKLLHKFHLDPSRALLPPEQVPQPKPAPPALSLSFKGEDLNPLMPQAPIVLDLLTKAGVQIDPAAIQNAMQLGLMAMQVQAAKAEAEREADAQPPHKGKVAQAESLDKHNADETGAMPGSGVMSPELGPMGGA